MADDGAGAAPGDAAAKGKGAMARAARALLATESVGVLSTLSVHRAGYPYGSLTPFALAADGAPLLLLSGLAAHTRNLLADARACLFVGERGAGEDLQDPADPQAGARVSLLGRACRVSAAQEPDARRRYLARWPRAEAYFQLGDFGLWQLDVEELRLIAGFGAMRWLPGSALAAD